MPDIVFNDWQQRVVTERQELMSKIVNLKVFMNDQKFFDLQVEDRALLQRQISVMENYVFILELRIKRWSQ